MRQIVVAARLPGSETVRWYWVAVAYEVKGLSHAGTGQTMR